VVLCVKSNYSNTLSSGQQQQTLLKLDHYLITNFALRPGYFAAGTKLLSGRTGEGEWG